MLQKKLSYCLCTPNKLKLRLREQHLVELNWLNFVVPIPSRLSHPIPAHQYLHASIPFWQHYRQLFSQLHNLLLNCHNFSPTSPSITTHKCTTYKSTWHRNDGRIYLRHTNGCSNQHATVNDGVRTTASVLSTALIYNRQLPKHRISQAGYCQNGKCLYTNNICSCWWQWSVNYCSYN